MSECDVFVMDQQNEEWFELVEYVETFDMSISFLEGPPGPPGPAGEAIFIPHVSEEGVLSWTNTAGLPNPDPIDLSGPAGTTDYADLSNKPSINGVQLSGNKTTADLLISFSKADVGLGNVDNVRQYSASNPPPYPVTAINGKTGAVSLNASDVGAIADDATIPVANGGTGATTPAAARANLGIPEPYNTTIVWSNSTPVDVLTEQTLTISESRLNFKYFYLEVYANSFAGGNRGALIVPANTLNAVYFPLACAGVSGWVRLQFDSSTTIRFLSSSYSSLLLNGIVGMK